MAITSSVFSRLQFNFDFPEGNEPVLSDGAIKSLETMPSLLEDWQANDIGNDDVGGYYRNPVSNTVNTIISLSSTVRNILLLPDPPNTIVTGTTTQITNLFSNTRSNLANIANTPIQTNGEGILFLDHTDRISGLIEPGAQPETGRDTSVLPHFEEAIGIGRILTYVTHQTDGIANTSVQTGSFTSLFIQNTLIEFSETLALYPDLITDSLNAITDGEGNIIGLQSNLSLSQAQTLDKVSSDIRSTFKQRREHDVIFFQNSRKIADDFSRATYFSKTGETQLKLITDFVGSDKLLSSDRLGGV